jgi:hypothetical protein
MLAVAGCGSPASPPASTGADAAARAFYESLIRNDDAAAYALLHPQSRQRITAEEFASLADNYRKRLGFQPAEVRLRSCEELDTEANAHVVLTGTKGQKRGLFRDAVHLKKSESSWAILLAPGFGRLH